MVHTIAIEDFLACSASEGGVVVDVRTYDEFAAGHIAGAVNLPLFTPAQRAEVGELYVKESREAAIDRGLQAVGGKLAGFVRTAREIDRPLFLYCARGGMRSGSMAWLLDMAGMQVRVLRDGYKAYRAHLEWLLDNNQWDMIVLSGCTGCGKSELLKRLAGLGEQVIDLEGLASHKGSAFGGLGQREQPTTEQFINLLHERLRELDCSRRIWCEGESMLIGHLFLPQKFYAVMQRAKQVEVTMGIEQRLDRLMAEYGGFSPEQLAAAFVKIKKRLGAQQMTLALSLLAAGDVRSAARIAVSYYDKSYSKGTASGKSIEFMVDGLDMGKSTRALIKMMDENS